MTDELRKAALDLVAHWDAVRERASKGRTGYQIANDSETHARLEQALRAALSAPTPEPSEAVTQEQVEAWARECGATQHICASDVLYTVSLDDFKRFATLAHAAGRAEAGKDAWLSIESAPMSYRGERPCYVLFWNGHHVGVGFCVEDDEDSTVTRYYDETTESIVPPPTHWMPTPTPPAAIDRAMSEKESAK